MKDSKVFFAVCLIAILFQNAESAKILSIFSHIGKSHFDVFEPYLEQLALRGHEVVSISHFPRKQQLQNFRDIDLRGTFPINKTTDVIEIKDAENFGNFITLLTLSDWGSQACEITLQHPEVRKIIQSNEKFDLLITEVFDTDCFVAFAHKFKIPIVAFSSCVLMPWHPDRIGEPDNPSFIPIQFVNSSNRMNFLERLQNTFWLVFHKIGSSFLMDAKVHKIASKHFGDSLPPISEMAKKTSLILLNNHFSLNGARPHVPGVIEVAGIHMKPAKKLPKDLEDYLNGAEHGVIYFSMGSMIRAETLPAEKRDAFLQAFAELPQRVLWKWEGDTLPGQPKNVKISKWLPQFDILNHPKVRVFLAHGGLLGTIEAVHVGVPMIGIPMYGDQSTNIKMIEDAGMGIRLNYVDITKENVLKALKTVLDNPSYKENAMRTSRAFRDRPMSPMDTAIYWTEYVIRHRGAPHMRTAGADLPLYQYLLLDVIAVLLVGLLTVLYVTYFIIKKTLSLLCGRSRKQDSSKKIQ